MDRIYLPTFAELIDRLSIVQLKAVFIQEHKDSYNKEIQDIKHDLNLLIHQKNIKISPKMIRAILVIMLTNRFIWENESRARAGDKSQDKLLKLTHSINGIRNQAKNIISQEIRERVDLKVDALAAELIAEYGAWDIWNMQLKKN